MSDRAIQRYDAWVNLLQRPDLSCLPARGRRWTCAGDAFRRETIKRDLASAYVQYRRTAHVDESAVVSLRKRARLQLVKRA